MGDSTVSGDTGDKFASPSDWMSRLVEEEGKDQVNSSLKGISRTRSEYYNGLVDLIQVSSSQENVNSDGGGKKGITQSPSKAISSREYDDVEVDLKRSFGDNLQESNTIKNRQEIKEILLAFAVHNRSVGYVQGMNFLCAMCLEYLGKEDSFWLLVHMTRRLPKNFYRKAGAEECLLFQKVVEKYAPNIKQYMGETYETVLNLFIFQWMLPLFVHAVEKDVNLLIWEHLFCNKSLQDPQGSNAGSFSNAGNVSLRLHQMCLRILVHFGSQAIEESQAILIGTSEKTVSGVATEFQAGVSFVRKVLHGARDIAPNDALPWEMDTLPTIDKMWFEKEREKQAAIVRHDESNVMHRKMSSVDFMYLDRKRLRELEIELGHYNATMLNMTQFVEAFLATATMAQSGGMHGSVHDASQNANTFACQLFSAIDRGEKGVLDRNELLCASIMVSTLSVEEKLHRCFTVYGKDGTASSPVPEISKVHTLSIFSTLLKLAQDWYGIEGHDHVFDDPKLLRRLFSWDKDTGINLHEFQQMIRVHTRLIICIEPLERTMKKGVLGNDSGDTDTGNKISPDSSEAESIWYFRNLINTDMDFIGRCGGWDRKQMHDMFNNPVEKPPRQRSSSWAEIGSPARHESQRATLTPPLRPKNNSAGDGLQRIGTSAYGDHFQSTIPGNDMLKKLKKAKNIKGPGANPGRGFCSAGSLDSCIVA